MEATLEIEYDMSDVEIFCLEEIDINDYLRKKLIESMKKEENSLHLY